MFRHRRRQREIVYDDHLLFITAYKWGARSEINTNQPFFSAASVIDTPVCAPPLSGISSDVFPGVSSVISLVSGGGELGGTLEGESGDGLGG
jgi:hypothetical protein